MPAKAKLFLGKILMVLSVVFIICGLFLQFGTTTILNPIDDVTVVTGENNENISITTIDDSDVIKNNSGSLSGDNNVLNKSSQAVAEDNVKLRDSIQKKYGIVVKYGKETDGYSVGGMLVESFQDVYTAQSALLNLEKALSLYPDNIFKELRSKGFLLTVYLIKRYSSNNVTGATDSTYKNVIVSVATDYDFEDTVHHEIYHYIEKYIFSTGFRFTSWDTINPYGFNYGIVEPHLSYTKTFLDDATFVNIYAQTDEYEDRASTFEYMMKSSKAGCFNYGNTVWMKAKIMSEQIDYFLDSVSPNVIEYWERYIY